MKQRLGFGLAAIAVLVIGSLWFASHRGQRTVPSVPIQVQTSSATEQARAQEPPGSLALRHNLKVVATPVAQGAAAAKPPSETNSQAAGARPEVNPSQVSAVSEALQELKSIYGSAGSLDWERARALIAQRQKTTQHLLERLAKLGPGGARAIATGCGQADSTREKLLLIHALGAINDPEASEQLQALLGKEASLSVRKEIVIALAQRKEVIAEQALAHILAEANEVTLRFAAAQALSGREGVLPVLVAQVQHESNPDVRQELVHAIGALGTASAQEALAGVARSSADLLVRQTAIQQLSRSFGESALTTLDGLLNDRDETIRRSAVKAVARVKADPATVLLQRTANSEVSSVVRDAALAALASIRSRGETPSLGRMATP